MQFLYPQFLYAFFTLLIPILIHLFYFRRFKTIYFSNVRFLSQLREEKQTRSRLKNWLVLLSRLLLLSCLILAFAQPYYTNESKANKPGKQAISLYIDNSFSMRSVGEEGSLIETAKKKAREISQGYREADEFQVLTNDFQVKHQQFYSRTDLFNHLDGIQGSPNTKPLSNIIDRQTTLLKEEEASNKIAFILSDFQQTTTDFQKINTDSNITYYFIPLKATQKANVFIDSAWLASPTIQLNQNNQLNYRLTNAGKEPIEDLTAQLSINGQQKGLSNVTIPANESITEQIVFQVGQTGWNDGQLKIEDYPITFDDQYHISYPVKEKAKVLAINENQGNPYLKAAYKTDDYFDLTNKQASNLDYSALPGYDFIIVNELTDPSTGLMAGLSDYAENGGNVLVLPPSNANSEKPYKSFLQQVNANHFTEVVQKEQEISTLNYEHALFQDVFEEIPENVQLPSVSQFFNTTNRAQTQERELISLKNGESLLSLYPFKQGNIFVSAVPFSKEWTNLTQNALFVPLIYKMAFYEESPRQLAYTIGEDQVINLQRSKTNKDQVFKLVKGDFEMIPPQKQQSGNWRLFLNDQIPEAGIYQLLPNQPSAKTDDRKNPQYAFNYNRQESRMASYSESDLSEFTQRNGVNLITDQYANLEQTVKRAEQGQALWKIFIWLALGFLLVEILLLKFLP